MFRLISKFLLWLWGFKIEGEIPADLKKYLLIAAPHTSAWDFPLGILVRSVIRRNVLYLAKDSLFKGPFAFIFRGLGGYPVDRSKSTNLVDNIVALYNENERFATVIAPEGTRKKVDRLKSGFYHIAHLAKVPLILLKIDFENKVVSFGEPFYTTDDKAADLAKIWAYFKGVQGKNPELGIN